MGPKTGWRGESAGSRRSWPTLRGRLIRQSHSTGCPGPSVSPRSGATSGPARSQRALSADAPVQSGARAEVAAHPHSRESTEPEPPAYAALPAGRGNRSSQRQSLHLAADTPTSWGSQSRRQFRRVIHRRGAFSAAERDVESDSSRELPSLHESGEPAAQT